MDSLHGLIVVACASEHYARRGLRTMRCAQEQLRRMHWYWKIEGNELRGISNMHHSHNYCPSDEKIDSDL